MQTGINGEVLIIGTLLALLWACVHMRVPRNRVVAIGRGSSLST